MQNKILIMDDEENIRFAFKSVFDREYTVLTAANGPEAIELIQTERPFIAFLDINMPGLSGVEVLKQIKETGVPVLIWMLTGIEDLETVKETLELGAVGYITKPFEIEKLKRVVLNAAISHDSGAHPSEKPWGVAKPQ